MKRPEAIALAVLIVVSLGVWAVWARHWQARNAQRDEMYALYAEGGRDSLRRLSEYPSPEAMQLIEKLAQDRNAFAEERLEAINILRAKHRIQSKTISPLLGIEQPFAIRHAAAEAFEQGGCDDQCLSATLYGLHAIWKGEPAIEAAPATRELEQKYGVHLDTDLDKKIRAELRDKTEQGYWKLLSTNPCETRKDLVKNYSAEPTFVQHVQSKIGLC